MSLLHLTVFIICLEYKNWLPYFVTSQVVEKYEAMVE
jgi:hypothetical protein